MNHEQGIPSCYLVVDVFLHGVVVARFNLAQVKVEVDIVPHVVVLRDVFLKALQDIYSTYRHQVQYHTLTCFTCMCVAHRR